jgi:enoyl-CoA hydratase/carnithine racemase
MATVLSLIHAIEHLPVPTLALVHGRCFAGALEVALACDLIWAAAGTEIGQLEAVVGGFPFAGGTQRLASRIGASRAAEMVIGAGIYPAETLVDWGLLSRVIAADRLEEEGRRSEGPRVILSQDLQRGAASLIGSGPGHRALTSSSSRVAAAHSVSVPV